jgi:hypothetical protein
VNPSADLYHSPPYTFPNDLVDLELRSRWRKMPWEQKEGIIKHLARIQAQLFDRQFDLIGDLRFKPELPSPQHIIGCQPLKVRSAIIGLAIIFTFFPLCVILLVTVTLVRWELKRNHRHYFDIVSISQDESGTCCGRIRGTRTWTMV